MPRDEWSSGSCDHDPRHPRKMSRDQCIACLRKRVRELTARYEVRKQGFTDVCNQLATRGEEKPNR